MNAARSLRVVSRSCPILVYAIVFAGLAPACDGDIEGETQATTTTASSVGGAGGSAPSTGGAMAAGGIGGASTGSAGQGGVPWEDALDPDAGPSSRRLTAHPLGSTSAPQGFYEYLPPGYPGGAKWPLLLALHGVGENGDGDSQLENVIHVGIGKLIAGDTWPNDRPFVVLVPQHPGGGCPSASEIKAFLTWGTQNYDIVQSRVYQTGLSCGAIGSWSYVEQELDAILAAFVPIAGDGKGAWQSKMCDLGKIPIWAFHGDADGTVDVSGTNVPMDGLEGCPHPPAKETKKTIYPGVGHNSWDQTYDLSAGHDIYTWMLGFTHD